MRTQKEILVRIQEVAANDLVGFETNDLLITLEYNNAKPWLKEDTTESEWLEDQPDCTNDGIKKTIIEYLPFAFEKADNARGLSASRSLAHYSAWLWLLNDEAIYKEFVETKPEGYGQNVLMVIAKHFAPGIYQDRQSWCNHG